MALQKTGGYFIKLLTIVFRKGEFVFGQNGSEGKKYATGNEWA